MRPGLFLPRVPLWIGVARVGAAVLVLRCNSKDRLTFPNPGPIGSGRKPSGDTATRQFPVQ